MSANKKEKDDSTPQKSKAVMDRYYSRLALLRKAQEHSQADNIPNAVEMYNKYLYALSKYYGVEEHQLRPSMFDQKKEIPELLLISRVYWDLSKAYDRNPKLKKECERCLSQFVKFTIGYKYQYLNSESIRKFVKQNMAYNPKAFQNAYNEIRVNSKKCYIATYCLGENHPATYTLRIFKENILKYNWGINFVEYYYRVSPNIIEFSNKYPYFGKTMKFFSSPILRLFAKLYRKTII